MLSPESQRFLQGLGDRELGVICVVGKYRTGKSFFLNRVLLNKDGDSPQGFTVGPTVQPCTKGLLLWNHLLQSTSNYSPNNKVLLIDTEGFGATDQKSDDT